MKRLWREKTQYSVARLNTGKRACMYNETFETRNEENKDLNLYRASLPPPFHARNNSKLNSIDSTVDFDVELHAWAGKRKKQIQGKEGRTALLPSLA